MNTAASANVSDVSPSEAYEKLKIASAVLVDVRTKAEWNFVGTPVPPETGQRLIQIEWLAFPEMAVNPEFTGELFAHFGDRFPEEIYFICRSGVRSLEAADYVCELLEELGRSTVCFNVAEGFEGDLDKESGKHRGLENGWKKRKLPWRQT